MSFVNPKQPRHLTRSRRLEALTTKESKFSCVWATLNGPPSSLGVIGALPQELIDKIFANLYTPADQFMVKDGPDGDFLFIPVQQSAAVPRQACRQMRQLAWSAMIAESTLVFDQPESYSSFFKSFTGIERKGKLITIANAHLIFDFAYECPDLDASLPLCVPEEFEDYFAEAVESANLYLEDWSKALQLTGKRIFPQCITFDLRDMRMFESWDIVSESNLDSWLKRKKKILEGLAINNRDSSLSICVHFLWEQQNCLTFYPDVAGIKCSETCGLCNRIPPPSNSESCDDAVYTCGITHGARIPRDLCRPLDVNPIAMLDYWKH